MRRISSSLSTVTCGDIGRLTGSRSLDSGNERPLGGIFWLDTWLL
jgi:hypothetical protein